ncbi:MAG TPA: hypothetical protein VGS20_11830 [Candidatus Acidoferrales bacterium]|nr:hypothetical protein [Candidatus Acidoferrales bacterium]
MAGYSGTPLVNKLGIKEGHRVAFLDEPPHYRRALGQLPRGVLCLSRFAGKFDLIQLFTTAASQLERGFARARKHLDSNGALLVSWPKRSSGVSTELDENAVRRIGLALGLVDVKVCAVDHTWSGLKFVRRLNDRVPR